MATKSKKMSNEGHSEKVPLGGTIGLVFVIGLVVGSIVVFLAVAGRTENVVQQRRALLQEKNAREAGEPSPSPADSTPAAKAAQDAPVSNSQPVP